MGALQKWCKFGLIGCVVGLSLWGCSQSARKPGQRPLTAAEIQQLQREFAETMAEMPKRIKTFPIYADQRKVADKKALEDFQTAWAKVNPSIATFLGQRDITHPFAVYPSRQPGQVCVWYGYGEAEDNFRGAILTVGKVAADGRIYTQNNEILFLEGIYMVTFVVDRDNKPIVGIAPVAYLYNEVRDGKQELQQQKEQELKALGCTMGLP
jgi:hypothetical protein